MCYRCGHGMLAGVVAAQERVVSSLWYGAEVSCQSAALKIFFFGGGDGVTGD